MDTKNLNKTDAAEIFGGSQSGLAKALGVTRQAVFQWPETLTPRQADAVLGAAVRLGLLKLTRNDATRLREGSET